MNGIFEAATRRAVRAFQEAHGLTGDGQLGTETWQQLLKYKPFKVEWASSSPIVSSLTRGAQGSSLSDAGVTHEPESATVPAVRDELRSRRR